MRYKQRSQEDKTCVTVKIMNFLMLLTHVAGGEPELEIVELERGGGDVDAEERGGVPVEDPDRRV